MPSVMRTDSGFDADTSTHDINRLHGLTEKWSKKKYTEIESRRKRERERERERERDSEREEDRETKIGKDMQTVM